MPVISVDFRVNGTVNVQNGEYIVEMGMNLISFHYIENEFHDIREYSKKKSELIIREPIKLNQKDWYTIKVQQISKAIFDNIVK